MKKKIIYLMFLIYPYINYGQLMTLTFIDSDSKEKITDVKIISDDDEVIAISNNNGHAKVDENLKNITFSNFLYEVIKIENIKTQIIELKRKTTILEEVTITNKIIKKYYKLKVYFRSWRLINNKIQNYAEGVKYVIVPKEGSKKGKDYFTDYITYKDEDFKDSFISIKFGDGFLYTKIPKEDYYTQYKHIYTLSKENNEKYILKEENKPVGRVIYDDGKIMEVIKNSNINGEIFGKSISYNDYVYEKWNNTPFRHLSMKRETIKQEVKKRKEVLLRETVTELFIENEGFENIEKPKTYKKTVNPEKSFLKDSFYLKYRKKYPLPLEIRKQVENIEPNENTYK